MSVTEQDVRAAAPANTPEDVIDWVTKIAELTKPEAVEFSDGSDAEWKRLTDLMVESGTFTRLNEEKRPTLSWHVRCLQMWHASSRVPSSALRRKRMQAPLTTGQIPRK